jgi:cysteine desulfurase
LEKLGFRVTYLDVDHDGFVNIKQLKQSISKKTLIVSVMHANNEIGTIQPINEIVKICKQYNVILHSDAVQSLGKVKIDVRKIGIDLMSFSAHKIHGPKGVGALFIKKGTPIKRIQDGGPQEFQLRAGTENVAGIVGFAKALSLYSETDKKKMLKLRNKLIKELTSIEGVKLNGSFDNRLCNNVNVRFKGIESEALGNYLDAVGICTSAGSACSSRSLKPSRILLAIGLTPEQANTSLRFTLGRFTTEQEIDYTIKMVKKFVSKLRRMSPFWKK